MSVVVLASVLDWGCANYHENAGTATNVGIFVEAVKVYKCPK